MCEILLLSAWAYISWRLTFRFNQKLKIAYTQINTNISP